MKIEQFNNLTLDALRKELQKKMDEVSEKYQIELKVGSISYSNISCKIKVEGFTKGGKKEKEDSEWGMAKFMGLDEDVRGKSFTNNEKTFTIESLDRKKRKYPVICSCNNGKSYKFSVEDIKHHLKK